jgi:hypothetical protein
LVGVGESHQAGPADGRRDAGWGHALPGRGQEVTQPPGPRPAEAGKRRGAGRGR